MKRPSPFFGLLVVHCLLKDIFWKVSGLDTDLFAHQEEIDLCWRLQNLGYEIWVEPKSIVYHVGGGTLNQGSLIKII